MISVVEREFFLNIAIWMNLQQLLSARFSTAQFLRLKYRLKHSFFTIIAINSGADLRGGGAFLNSFIQSGPNLTI